MGKPKPAQVLRKPLGSLDDSALMKRLRTSDEALALAADVKDVADSAAKLLGTVIRDMPLYTLHTERHVLNVIGWMESLLTAEGIQVLSPLECAMCILAAYTHDLGMTLSEKESVELASDPNYLRFRDRFLEERQLVERLRDQGNHERASRIENHLRTEYLRSTHADERAERLRRRLDELAPGRDYTYQNFNYRRQLELVAISHNQPVEWLRLEFERKNLAWRDTAGHEPVDFALAGILLRLADIMDFDSSRTPTILFQHLGLDGELADRFEKISSQEWSKHLAITGIDWPAKDNVLTYRASQCPHPVVEKAFAISQA